MVSPCLHYFLDILYKRLIASRASKLIGLGADLGRTALAEWQGIVRPR
jgi:hypothetical protein